MTDILDKLRGGDLRSIGKANEVAHQIANNPEIFKSVFSGLRNNDPIIRMRSADAIEKVTKDMPELLADYTSEIITLLESAEQQEVCWHLAQITPRLDLTKSGERQVVALLKKLLSHKSKIVRVSAMDALASFAERNESLLKEVTEIIKAQMKEGSPAILSRGRKLLKRLKGRNENVKT